MDPHQMVSVTMLVYIHYLEMLLRNFYFDHLTSLLASSNTTSDIIKNAIVLNYTFEVVNFRQQKSESTFYYSSAKVASSIFIKEKKLSVSEKVHFTIFDLITAVLI